MWLGRVFVKGVARLGLANTVNSRISVFSEATSTVNSSISAFSEAANTINSSISQRLQSTVNILYVAAFLSFRRCKYCKERHF